MASKVGRCELTSLQHSFRWQRWNDSVGKSLEQNLVEYVEIAVAPVHRYFVSLKQKKHKSKEP